MWIVHLGAHSKRIRESRPPRKDEAHQTEGSDAQAMQAGRLVCSRRGPKEHRDVLEKTGHPGNASNRPRGHSASATPDQVDARVLEIFCLLLRRGPVLVTPAHQYHSQAQVF